MRGSSRTPRKLTTPKPINISETIKKGKSEGKTISHHIFKPLIEASRDSFGNEINEAAISVTVKDKKRVFSLD
jgi:hypothetical protein